MGLETFSAADLARVVRVYAGALKEHRAALNRLNVYPVPDGDTGTNMSLTLDAVRSELDEAVGGRPGGPDMETVAKSLSHGSLMGARGNSGVILSQILRGMASGFRDAPAPASLPGLHSAGQGIPGVAGRGDETGSQNAQLGPGAMADAFARASEGAYAAVSNPVEGTILTVARGAARGAGDALSADSGANLSQVLSAARQSAADALAGTTDQLPELKAAGVVDAGGAGLLLLFDSFLNVADGWEVQPPPLPAGVAFLPSREGLALPGPAQRGELAGGAARAPGSRQGATGDVGDLRYEGMFFLEAPDDSVPAFRSVWGGYGGSIVIVGGDGIYNCHIHTDDIGGAIEAAIEIGHPRQIRVTDLSEQVEEERWVREAAASQQEVPPVAVNCAVVAVCSGEGVKRIFRSLGANQIVSGGQSANPSTAELLDAVAAANADQVVVLPNNPNVIAVAEQAAAHATKKVAVVPTGGIPEGFAALLAYDPEADLETNAANMALAASRVVSGEVAQASRDAETPAGRVHEGDWLALSRDGVKAVAPAPSTAADAAIALLADLVPEGAEYEIVTVIEGEGAHPSDTRRIIEWLTENRPGVGTEVHHGGQPVYPYLFSIE